MDGVFVLFLSVFLFWLVTVIILICKIARIVMDALEWALPVIFFVSQACLGAFLGGLRFALPKVNWLLSAALSGVEQVAKDSLQNRKGSPEFGPSMDAPRYGSIVQDSKGDVVMVVVYTSSTASSPAAPVLSSKVNAVRTPATASLAAECTAPRFQPVTMMPPKLMRKPARNESEPHCFMRSGKRYNRSRLGGGVGSSNRIRRNCGRKCQVMVNEDYRYALNNAQYQAHQADERTRAYSY